MTPMMVVVGLGNPGMRYAGTRHNVGFMVADALARQSGRTQWAEQFLSLICRLELGGREVLLVKPQTFMNLSGQVIGAMRSALSLAVEDLIIVLDDLNLPFGRIRIRRQGSAGGHRGMESVLEAAGTEEMTRVRIGIGEENMPQDKAAFVLSDFSHERAQELSDLIHRAANAIDTIIVDGVSKAMAVFNA